jgi:hypothetical protein
MIKGINSSSRHITVVGGSPSNPYISPGAVGSGAVRWNGNTNCIEINDGNMWQQLNSSYTSIDLGDEAKQILAWAAEKMREERELEALCAKYPGLAKARDNYEMFKKFVAAQEQADDDSEGMQVAASP